MEFGLFACWLNFVKVNVLFVFFRNVMYLTSYVVR